MAPKRKVIPSSLASQSSQRTSQRDEDDYESEEEAEVIPSNNRKRKATQGNSRAKKPKATQEPPNFNLLEQEEEHLLGSLMRFCLFKDTNKLPIKKDDMTATVLGEKYKGRKGLLDSLLKKASERFVKIFGFELVEIERHDTNADVTTKSSTATQKQKKKSSGIWILRLLPADHGLPLYDMSKKELKQASSDSIQRKRRDFSFDGLEQSQMGLLMVLVCLIQIRKNRLDEEEMWKLLSKLGIEKGHHHSVFGLPEKLIQQFEKQFYIEKNKDELGMKTKEHTNTLYIYQHGSRLRKELLDMDQILNFLTEVTGSAVDKATHTEFRNMHGVDDESEEEEVVGPTPTPPRR